MIDLHCHILPGLDDGAADISVAIQMARMAAADGVTTIACTPHFRAGVYETPGESVRHAMRLLQQKIADEGVPIELVSGGDVHIAPGLASALREGRVLSLNDTRYVLIEPPSVILPPRVGQIFFDLLAAGFQPILTHPERLSWIEGKYEKLVEMSRSGVWMQLTASSLLGAFGRRPKYCSERMLDEGLVQIVASDAHDLKCRPPDLGRAFPILEQRVGPTEARNLVLHRPEAILRDKSPLEIAPLGPPSAASSDPSMWRRILAVFRED